MRKLLANMFHHLSEFFYRLSWRAMGYNLSYRPLRGLPTPGPNRLLRVWRGKSGFRRKARVLMTMRANLQKAR